MAATLQRLRSGGGGFIRMGPKHFAWGHQWTRFLGFEMIRPNVALLCGTKGRLSRQEYRWLVDLLVSEGLRAAMERVVKDGRGRPKLDKDGKVITRTVMCAMPHPRKRYQPALLKWLQLLRSKPMTINAPKTHIPHPKHAHGNTAKFMEHGMHVGIQVASGHYVPDGGDQHVEADGTVVTTLRLKPTNPAATAAPSPE